jgi:hypothetical protein
MQICCIHTTDERVFRPHQNPRLYTWMDQGNQRQVYTMAPKILRAHRMLDPRLRHLLVRCHAIEYNDIPSLQEVLNETELAVANNDPFDPRINSRAALGQGVLETDEYIRNLVQEIFHNAD